jgi:hypothetical protein
MFQFKSLYKCIKEDLEKKVDLTFLLLEDIELIYD